MEIKLFRTDKKLMFRLPNEEKDTPAYELFLGVLMLKPEQIKEKLGNELPVVVAACEVSDKEELDKVKFTATYKFDSGSFDLSNEVIEYSHCFGKVNCAFKLSNESIPNNEHKNVLLINKVSIL